MTVRGTYTEAEVAERFGRSRRTIRAWAAKGLLPVLEMPGTRRRYPAAAIDRLVDEGHVREVSA